MCWRCPFLALQPLQPAVNRQSLAAYLKSEGIKYAFFGRELGARTDDPSCHVDGQVRYARLAARDDFRQAIARLTKGASDHRIALMCAEKEPLYCHRTILVAQALVGAGCAVEHIHIDGSLESHAAALERLLDISGIPATDLFKSKAELLTEALARHESRIAYRKSDPQA